MHFECPVCKKLISLHSDKLGSGKVQCTNCTKSVETPKTRLSPGAVLGDFIMREETGQGGMGIVYRSDQISFARPAAVKYSQKNTQQNFHLLLTFFVKLDRQHC